MSLPGEDPPRVHPLSWLVVAAALVYYVWRLDEWALWGDEAWTWDTSGLPLPELLEAVRGDKHPPLYFMLVRMVRGWSDSDPALRLPSAWASFAAAVAVVAVATRAMGRATGLLAAVVFCLAPFTVVYSGIARSVALCVMLGAVLMWASAQYTLGRHRPALAGAVAVVGALGLYTHYAMLAPLLAAGVAMILVPRVPPRGRALAVAAVVVAGALFTPWVVTALGSRLAAMPTFGKSSFLPVFLVWPVGNYVPWSAWPLLPLFAIGLLAMFRDGDPVFRTVRAWGWAAVLSPLLLGFFPDARWKMYIYAPFLPVWAICVANGLRVFTWSARLSWRTGLAVVAVAFIQGSDLSTLAELDAVPMGRVAEGAGVIDIRQDARVTALAGPGRIATSGPHCWRWQRYSRRSGNEVTDSVSTGEAWKCEFRHPSVDFRAAKWKAAPPECVFQEAFAYSVLVQPNNECQSARRAVDEIARNEGYGPFLLEQADLAYALGNKKTAWDLAVRAAEATPAGAGPELMLARITLEEGDPVDVQVYVDQGLEKAYRYGQRLQAVALLDLAADAALAAGSSEALYAANAEKECVVRMTALALCGTRFQDSWLAEVMRYFEPAPAFATSDRRRLPAPKTGPGPGSAYRQRRMNGWSVGNRKEQ